MDKQTLSNYGWITVCILVLSVMIALATPFGKFISDGFKTTYTGLNDVSNKALAAVALGGNGGEQGGAGETTPCAHENLTYASNGDRTHTETCADCASVVGTANCVAGTFTSNGEGTYQHTVYCKHCSGAIITTYVCSDGNADGFCDKCGAVACPHPETVLKKTTVNGVKHHTLRCTQCNANIGSREACADTNSDGLCDVCGAALETSGSGGSGSGENGGEQGGTGETTPCTHKNLTYTSNGDKTHTKTCADCASVVGTANCVAGTFTSNGEGTYKHTAYCKHCSGLVSAVMACSDGNADGFCDKCGAVACTHPETVLKNIKSNGVWYHALTCTQCNFTVGSKEACADTDSNGLCDVCGRNICTHSASSYVGNDDGISHKIICDTCGKIMGSEVCSDTDTDNDVLCDVCGFCMHSNKRLCVSNGDGTHNNVCYDCDVVVDNQTCYDNNGNGKCDKCQSTVG